MAKLKAPLLSLGASGALGEALVYFPWKGLNVVREYVVPTNPRSAAQTIQRDYLAAAVAAVHAAEALAAHALAELDKIAYAQWGLNWKDPRTWFNVICKSFMDQNVASLKGSIYHGASVTGGDTIITFDLYFTDQGANHITAGDFWYGKTRTSMPNHVAATMYDAPYLAIGDISGLTNGVKYFVQFRPTAHADFVGCNSGIYTSIPRA